MATQVQWRRGTTTQNNTYTGAIGEITVDTTLKQLRLHDGVTAGGTIIGSNAVTVSTATNLAGGTAGQIPYQTAAGATSFFGAGTAGTVLVSYGSTGIPTFQNTLTLSGTSTSISTTTGALVVAGGVGIGGDLRVGGEIFASRITVQLTTVTTTLVTTDDIISTYNTTQSNSTTTGALQIAGGAGIGLDVTVGGSIRVASVITATTFIGNLTGNITGNGTGNLHYQSANNTTSFLSTGTTGQLLVAAGGAPVWTSTTSIYVNRATLADTATTATNAATAYSTIGTLSTGTGFFGGSFNGSANQTLTLNTATLMTTAVNIVGGAAGSLPYQTAAGTTTMLGLGTNGFVLTAGASAPTWTAISGLSAGLATTATNLAGGNAFQIPYQTAPGLTAFANSGTTGQFWQATTNGAPVWTTTANIYVANAVTATHQRGGTAGQLQYQSAADTTAFISTATTGNFLQANFAGAPTWTGTASMQVGYSANLLGAGTGNILIQSGSNTTALLSTGTAGQLLMSAGGQPVFTNTGSIYVAAATQVNTVNQSANATYYPTFVDANNATASAESFHTTSSFIINPATGQVGLGFISTSSRLTVNGRIESITDPASEGGQVVLRGKSFYRWSIDNYQDGLRIIREDDVTEANGVVALGISSGTNSTVMLGTITPYSGERLAVNGGVYVNGVLTATTIYGTFAGSIGGSVSINTATNVAGGTAGQLHYQSAPGATSFVSTATTGNFLQANFTSAPTWITSGTMYVGNAVQAEAVKGGGNGSLLYQSAANTTSFLSTGTPGQLLMAGVGAPTFTNTSSIYVNSARFADNITGAGTGNIHIQSANNTTSFLSTGTTGQLLVAAGGAPVFTNTSSISVGYSANILGAGTGNIHIQSANNTTALLSTGTAGQLLMSAGGAPVFTNTSSIYVNSARYSDNITGGAVGSIPIQSAAGTTSFVPLGTSGYVLTAGATTATWQAVSTLAAGTATNLANGLANQLVYQTAPGTTGFISTSTTGNFLQATTNGAPSWTATGTMQVGYSANILGAGTGNILIQSGSNTTALLSTGTSGQLLMAAGGQPVFTNTGSIYVAAATQVNTVIQTTNASYFPTFVDSNNTASGAESFYTTSSFQINPSTGLTSLSGRLAVNNADASTTTNTANALYVAGGAWINKNLTVAGDTTFQGSVVFQGTNTFVYSSSTVYTDNLISLHAPSGTGPGNHTWTVDDGKDIGFMFHYYKTTDKDAFLGFDNATSYLEWFDNGTESDGIFTGTSFGTFRTGAIKLVGGAVNSGNTSSGDLTVLGGVGIGQNLYVAGNINVAGTINASITGISTTATNLASGTAGQIPYQFAPGTTLFTGPGSFGQFLMSTGANAPVYQSTLTQAGGNIIVTSNTGVSTTNSGALQVVNGGVGIGGGLVVGNITTITNTTNASSTTTGALQVVGGVGIGGNIYFNGNLYQNGVLFTSGSTSTTSTFTISNTTQSTSTTTGALVVAGGFGLGGNFYSGGTIVNINGTNATSTTTGALQIINGGAGIGRDLWVGGAIYVAGSRVLPTSIQEFTATGGQTTFTVSGGYTVGTVQVFANGVQLANADFTASNGTTVVLAEARVSGDIIRTVSGLTSSSVNNINALSLAYAVTFGG